MIKISKLLRIILVLTAMAPMYASSVFADMGIPMLFITFPYMVVSLIPVILIEAYVILFVIRIDYWKSLRVSLVINSLSTLVGMPVTWVSLVLIQFITGGGTSYGLDSVLKKFMAVTWQAPWLIPYSDDLNWMIPVAMIVLLVPFFFASWIIEFIIARSLLKGQHADLLNRAVLWSNVVTYLIFLLILLVRLFFVIVLV